MSTNFHYGLKSRGVPLEPNAARFYGWWGKTAWFVDYDSGNDGNTGKDSTAAFKTLDEAITNASSGDVIYIRPRAVSGTDPQGIVPYAADTNWTVGHSLEGLGIIGAGPVIGMGVHYTYLKGGASATTGPVLDIQAPACSIENLAFHRGGCTSTGLLRFYGDGTSTYNAHNSSVYNCMFRFWNQAEGNSGAVVVQDAWWVTIANCDFYSCNNGIWLLGSASMLTGTTIRDCYFRGAAAAISADITLQGADMPYTIIDNCVFAHQTPTGGTNAYIYNATSATVTDGIISRCYFDDAVTPGAEIPTIGDMDIVACYDAAGLCDTGS
jgi:hypothetical protein